MSEEILKYTIFWTDLTRKAQQELVTALNLESSKKQLGQKSVTCSLRILVKKGSKLKEGKPYYFKKVKVRLFSGDIPRF